MTQELINKTREHFVKIYQGCIAEAASGKVYVNDLETYTVWCKRNIEDMMAGKSDHTFTFRQRAHWIETGECVPLLNF